MDTSRETRKRLKEVTGILFNLPRKGEEVIILLPDGNFLNSSVKSIISSKQNRVLKFSLEDICLTYSEDTGDWYLPGGMSNSSGELVQVFWGTVISEEYYNGETGEYVTPIGLKKFLEQQRSLKQQ